MKTRLLFGLLFGLCAFGASAQTTPRTVVGNAGDYYENLQFGNLHFTVGEVAVSNLQNGLVVSEGFHQGYYELLVSTDELPAPDWKVTVFPNPTADAVYVRTERDTPARGYLYDSRGRLLHEQPIAGGQTTFSLDRFPSGSYWLRLHDSLGGQRSFRIQKVAH